MDQPSLLEEINRVAGRERELRRTESSRTLSDTERGELQAIGVHLDQCWDVLRQWRARSEFGLNTDDITVRSAATVEGYQQ